jgi:uncharacterized protein YhhL (DUF1145 family)
MEFSAYLLQLFASYLFVIAFFFTVAYKRMAESMTSLLKDEALVRGSGLLRIFFGLALILAYMQIYDDYHIAIQVMAIFMLVTGTLRTLFYSKYKSMITKYITKKHRIFLIGLMYLISILFFGLVR